MRDVIFGNRRVWGGVGVVAVVLFGVSLKHAVCGVAGGGLPRRSSREPVECRRGSHGSPRIPTGCHRMPRDAAGPRGASDGIPREFPARDFQLEVPREFFRAHLMGWVVSAVLLG